MEDYRITADQILASSQFDIFHGATQGRLHIKASGHYQAGWSAAVNDLDQWFQIDLRIKTSITAVATQGRPAFNQWVTKYKLQYSSDGNSFQVYKQQGEKPDKVRNVCFTITKRKKILSTANHRRPKLTFREIDRSFSRLLSD